MNKERQSGLIRLPNHLATNTGVTPARVGVPLHAVFRSQLTLEQLQAALSSVPVASVVLHSSLLTLLPASSSVAVPALAHSALTLTALHGLPLPELPDSHGLQLAAFSQLRALTLHHKRDSVRVLRATHLPPSLLEITVSVHKPPNDYFAGMHMPPPLLVDFDRLHSLRRVSLACYTEWQLQSWSDQDQTIPVQLPPSLQVRRVCSAPAPRIQASVCLKDMNMVPTTLMTAASARSCTEGVMMMQGCSFGSRSMAGHDSALSSQTVRLQAWNVDLQSISVFGPKNHWMDALVEGAGGSRPSCQLPHGLGAITLDICGNIDINMAYTTADSGPGARCSHMCVRRLFVLLLTAACTASGPDCQVASSPPWISALDLAGVQHVLFAAGGRMLAWEGRGSGFPLGFAALRVQTNYFSIWATELQPHAAPEAYRRRTSPVRLLCRTLRLAPVSYRRFELAAKDPAKPMQMFAGVSLTCGEKRGMHRARAKFDSIAELAVAMRRFASSEGLSVTIMTDLQSIIVTRNDD